MNGQKPLRSQLNQIRAWVRQGRTDAWIAHQLDVPAAGAARVPPPPRARARGRGGRRARAPRRDRGRDRGRRRTRRRTKPRTRTKTRRTRTRRARTRPTRASGERRGRRGRPGAAAGAGGAGGGGGASAPGAAMQATFDHGDRRRLRALARSGGRGRPGLHRALGRPPPGRGDDRAGPDRHQARLTLGRATAAGAPLDARPRPPPSARRRPSQALRRGPREVVAQVLEGAQVVRAGPADSSSRIFVSRTATGSSENRNSAIPASSSLSSATGTPPRCPRGAAAGRAARPRELGVGARRRRLARSGSAGSPTDGTQRRAGRRSIAAAQRPALAGLQGAQPRAAGRSVEREPRIADSAMWRIGCQW